MSDFLFKTDFRNVIGILFALVLILATVWVYRFFEWIKKRMRGEKNTLLGKEEKECKTQETYDEMVKGVA